MATQPISPYSSLTMQSQLPAVAPVREKQGAEAADKTTASTEDVSGTSSQPLTAAGSQKPSREQVDQAMKQVKQALPIPAQNLQFSVDEETGRTLVKIVDSATKEVIRQIPSEELLAITRELDKFSGLLVKQKV